ncbi:MAG: hypothetical protein CFE24_06545 [Flavobacterium sp. BFFFF2]|nr:MAG: hypothetical protein CFE24_06545 [Flavobacterium sp. BFFFF2]
MTYSIKFEEGALSDFFDGFLFYEKKSELLSERFHFEFWKTIDQIKPRLRIRLCNEREKDNKAGSARTFFTADVAKLH